MASTGVVVSVSLSTRVQFRKIKSGSSSDASSTPGESINVTLESNLISCSSPQICSIQASNDGLYSRESKADSRERESENKRNLCLEFLWFDHNNKYKG